MARLHSLMVWSVVLGFLTVASLGAADKKPPKTPAEKPKVHRSGDPFGGAEKFAKPAKATAKKPSNPVPNSMVPWRNVKAIEDALAGPTEMVFVETPLQDVVDYLKERHRIEIKIDNKALSDVGIGTDSPVTIDVKGVSLRSALKLMLRELSLTWTIQDEVLMITTPEEADNYLTTQLYDVADLVVCRDDHDQLWDDYDTLIDIITSTVKSTTWDDVGGAGSINGATIGTAKVLVVSQTREVHEHIADLLAKIREIAKKTPNAGVPRRNKPTQPPQRGKGAAGGAVGMGGGMGMGGMGMGGMGMGGMGGSMPAPSAKTPGKPGPAPKEQPKPDASKDKSGTGMF
jgi:hypothetical protein